MPPHQGGRFQVFLGEVKSPALGDSFTKRRYVLNSKWVIQDILRCQVHFPKRSHIYKGGEFHHGARS